MKRSHGFLKGARVRKTLFTYQKFTTVSKDLNNEIHNKTSIILLDLLYYIQKSMCKRRKWYFYTFFFQLNDLVFFVSDIRLSFFLKKKVFLFHTSLTCAIFIDFLFPYSKQDISTCWRKQLTHEPSFCCQGVLERGMIGTETIFGKGSFAEKSAQFFYASEGNAFLSSNVIR